MLSNDEIVANIQNAFSPHRCVAEVLDYGTKVKFKIFRDNKTIIANFNRTDIAEEDQLQDVLQQAKKRIFAKVKPMTNEQVKKKAKSNRGKK